MIFAIGPRRRRAPRLFDQLPRPHPSAPCPITLSYDHFGYPAPSRLSITDHVEASPQSVTIKAADVEVDVVPAVVAECDVLLNQQAKMYTQQRAEADDKLAGEIQAFMASAEQMRQELSDNVAALKAELAACTCMSAGTMTFLINLS